MGIKHNTLTDGSYTAVNDDTGHDCGHRHKTYGAAEMCWVATLARRNRGGQRDGAGRKARPDERKTIDD